MFLAKSKNLGKSNFEKHCLEITSEAEMLEFEGEDVKGEAEENTALWWMEEGSDGSWVPTGPEP